MIYWRDDDGGILTKAYRFQFVHEIFQKYRVIHTLALIMKDIEKNKELISYILSYKNEFNIQLHCWEHFDHGNDFEQAKESIFKGKKAIKDIFGVEAAIFFPPWNSCTQEIKEFCKSIGMLAMPEKISIEQYIKVNGDVKEEVVNFHGWHQPEVNDLHKALKIYNDRVNNG